MGEIQRTTLTAEEAAAYLGISYWKLLELAKAKKVPYTKPYGSRVYLFRKQALDDWMDKMESDSLGEQQIEETPILEKPSRLMKIL